MAEVTWKDLAKTVTDKTKISEEIDEDIKTHNEDASAHKQSGEAIDTHRIAEILDHIDEAVTNPKLKAKVRGFAAIVDAAGNYDYTTIQPAIDYVNGLGGGKILILNGTYNHTENLTLYSNIVLQGETPAGVVIQFSAIAKGIKGYGVGNAYSTGTISINNDSDQVVGLGTTWVGNIAPGDLIRLDNRWFEIKSIEDNTHLTLIKDYHGNNLSGIAHEVHTFKSDMEVRDLSIEGIGYGAYNQFQWAQRCTWRNIHGQGNQIVYLNMNRCKDFAILNSDGFRTDIYLSNRGVVQNNAMTWGNGNWIQYCWDVFVTSNVINTDANPALTIQYGKGIVVSGNSLRSNAGSIVTLYNSSECTVIGNYCYDGYQAVKLDGSHRCRIIGNHGEGGTEYGILLSNGSTYNIIKGNYLKNYAHPGIRLSSGADYNTIIGNIIKTVGVGNVEPGIYLFEADYNTIIGNKCLDATEDGIRVYGSNYNIITGNICRDNDQWGIKVTGVASNKNIITNNQLLGNTSGALEDLGAGTVKDNNVIA